ncbi:19609_t:CDS:2 [Rhizophagus irregularis]|nr:19609_t:CDS:2 [Rhizophagus irregularis]
MSSQNQNQPSHRIYKSTKEQNKILGGTPKQVHKINELEKGENKAGPAAASSSQEKAPSSSIEGATIHNLPLEAQTHDSDGGKIFPPIPNAQVHDSALGAHGRTSVTIPNPQTHDGRSSATIPNPQSHDGRSSATIPNPQTHDGRPSNYYARIPSILNGPPTLPSLQWVLNNPNETNDVILPPIYNNSTPQQIHLHTLEPDHEPDVPKLPFRL